MSHVSEFVAEAHEKSLLFPRCSPEQALVYSCEDIVDREIGSRTVASDNVHEWLTAVCTAEDLDTPHVVVQRATATVLASAEIDSNTICIRGRSTTYATLLHEVAHVASGAPLHNQVFRDEFVHLSRTHISVQYAAFLHALYTRVGLSVSPWSVAVRKH
jgi:hypothetical protein